MSTREPRLLAFVCNWCSYAAADSAGRSRLEHPAGVRLVRVMCSGRVEPAHVIAAFEAGADGVLVVGCHPGDCHYKEGNFRARNRMALLGRMLPQLGVDPARVRIDWAGAAEGERFQTIVREAYAAIASLGPLAPPAAADGEEVPA